MAHFAKVEDGIVTQVIVAEQDFIDSGAVGDPASWIQTSYNATIRGNYAGIGYHYIPEMDIFVRPKPYESWSLSETGGWTPPIPAPEEGRWIWNEEFQQWDEDTHVLPGLGE